MACLYSGCFVGVAENNVQHADRGREHVLFKALKTMDGDGLAELGPHSFQVFYVLPVVIHPS